MGPLAACQCGLLQRLQVQACTPDWGWSYLPGQLYNLTSRYGTKEQLVALNKALKGAGIVPVCDVVVNHRCADKQDEHGVWNRFGCGQPTPAGLAKALLARVGAGGELSTRAAE